MVLIDEHNVFEFGDRPVAANRRQFIEMNRILGAQALEVSPMQVLFEESTIDDIDVLDGYGIGVADHRWRIVA